MNDKACCGNCPKGEIVEYDGDVRVRCYAVPPSLADSLRPDRTSSWAFPAIDPDKCCAMHPRFGVVAEPVSVQTPEPLTTRKAPRRKGRR